MTGWLPTDLIPLILFYQMSVRKALGLKCRLPIYLQLTIATKILRFNILRPQNAKSSPASRQGQRSLFRYYSRMKP